MTQFDLDCGRAALTALLDANSDLFLNDMTLLLRGQKEDIYHVLKTMSRDLSEKRDDSIRISDDDGALFFVLYCNQILKKPELNSSDSYAHP